MLGRLVLREKSSYSEFFWSVLGPNAGKWTKTTPNTDTFHVVWELGNAEASSEWKVLPSMFQRITKIMG